MGQDLIPDDTILNLGESAPFTGVLTHERNYRFYRLQVKEADRLTDAFKHVDDYCSTDHSDLLLIGLLATTAGIVLGFVLDDLIKNHGNNQSQKKDVSIMIHFP